LEETTFAKELADEITAKETDFIRGTAFK